MVSGGCGGRGGGESGIREGVGLAAGASALIEDGAVNLREEEVIGGGHMAAEGGGGPE